MTTTDVAAVLGMRRTSVTALCERGKLVAARDSKGRWQIPPDEVERYANLRGLRPLTKSTDPAYRQLLDLAEHTTSARVMYAMRLMYRQLDQEHREQHAAYVLRAIGRGEDGR